MSRLIEKSISSAYIVRQAHLESLGLSSSGSDFMETTNSSVNRPFIDLPKELFQMLACVGPYFYRDTILLQKVHYFVLTLLLVLFLIGKKINKEAPKRRPKRCKKKYSSPYKKTNTKHVQNPTQLNLLSPNH